MGLIEELSPEFKRWCEAIATDQRSALGLRAFDRLPAYQLATHLGATILSPEQIPSLEPQYLNTLLTSNAWSAAVISSDPLQIVHNPRHAAARRESNLMHELGHILLQHRMIGFDSETNLPLRRPQDEKEATYLGGCLQAPHRGLLWAVQREMTSSQIAKHFGASEEMVLLRSNAVGLRHCLRQLNAS
jgi:hypothetical protein